jgi:hypothetical protein
MKSLLSAISFCTLVLSHSFPAHSMDNPLYERHSVYSCTHVEAPTLRQSYASPSSDTVSYSTLTPPTALLLVPTLLLFSIAYETVAIPFDQRAHFPEIQAVINNNNFVPLNAPDSRPAKKIKEPRSMFKNTSPKCTGKGNGGKGKKMRIQKHSFKPGR